MQSQRSLQGLFRVLLLVAPGALTGCSSVFVAPGTGSVAPSDIAVIKVDNPIRDGFVIFSIDDVPRGVGHFHLYKMPPGPHSIDVGVNQAFTDSHAYRRQFVAQAGHTYRIRLELDYPNMKWNYHVVDDANGTIADVGGISRSPQRAGTHIGRG